MIQLSSTRRLAIVYIKQPLLFYVQLSSARRLAIVYIKQPLLFLSINYLNAPFRHCLY